MAYLPLPLVDRLNSAAFEMGGIFTGRSHFIDSAVSLDPAFRRTRRPSSSLTLELMSEAFCTAMSRAGFAPHVVTGGALELTESIPGGFARIRLRKAEARADGYYVKANKASSFGEVDDALLDADYPHIFGFFVAPVRGVTQGNPGELILGTAIELGGQVTPVRDGFVPDLDDRLPGLDDEDVEGEDSAYA